MIVPMALVRIYGPKDDLDRATDLLYAMGVLHVEPLPPRLLSHVNVRDRRTEDREAVGERVELEALYDKVRKCLILLHRPAGAGVPAPTPDARELRSAQTAQSIDELSRRVEELTARRKEAADRLALLGKYEKMAGAILPLVERAGESAHLEMVGLTFGREHEGVVDLLEGELKRATGGLVQVFSTQVDERTLAALVVYGHSDASRVRSLLWERNLNELKLPTEIERLPLRDALAEIAAQAARLPDEVRALDAELALLSARWHARLEALHASLTARLQQIGTRSSFFKTRRSFVISGWIPQGALPRLERSLESEFDGRVVVERVAVSRDEERRVPIRLENPALIRPFEVFVRLLPLPVYRTVDATPFLAFFFPLFFGFIVGDVGYALVIGALAFALRRRAAPGGMIRDLATVLLWSSAVAVAFGFVFGEFFGTLGEAAGMRPLHPRAHRLHAIPFFLGLSIGVGCLHVFLGLALGIVNAIRTRHRAALKHRVGQAAALAGLILVVAAAAAVVDRALLAPAVALLLAGLALWVAAEGFAAPIELLSTAGNVLSYARLMAVGLAGVVLAMVANELGRRSLWGILAAVALHLVNILLCVFSPTIHAMRLHLVEFFTKFYETGGAAYKPLRRQEGR